MLPSTAFRVRVAVASVVQIDKPQDALWVNNRGEDELQPVVRLSNIPSDDCYTVRMVLIIFEICLRRIYDINI